MGTEYNAFTDSFSGSSSASNLAPEQRHNDIRATVGTGGSEITYRRDDSTGQTHAIVTGSAGQAVNSSDLAQGEGVERTVRSATGFPVLGRAYRPNDTVEVMGQRMEMGLAATLGLIARNPDGSFSFSGDAGSDRESAAEATQQAPEGQPEGDTFRASDDAEGALTALSETLAPGMQMAVLNALVETGQVDPEMIERMARQSGAEPADLARQIEAAHAGFYDSVIDRVEAMGVHDSDLFGDFIEGDPKLSREMQQAVRDLMMTNDATGFDRLADRFVQSLDRVDPQAVKDALSASGIPHRRSAGGDLVLTFEGHGEVSYREAVKQGLIRVSRA